jgi:hypothetical protein
MTSVETNPNERGLGKPCAGKPPARFNEGASSVAGDCGAALSTLLNANFPSVNYRVTVRPVAGAPVWKLDAEALDGSGSRILCESGPSAENLERERPVVFRL